MIRMMLIAGASMLALGGCTAERSGTEPVDLADDSSITIAGEPQDCVPIAAIRDTDVVDDYTIDFRVGSTLYRNRLPNRCIGLAAADAFSYETSLSRLCDNDIVYVLRSYGGDLERGAACGLGDFTPIEKVR